MAKKRVATICDLCLEPLEDETITEYDGFYLCPKCSKMAKEEQISIPAMIVCDGCLELMEKSDCTNCDGYNLCSECFKEQRFPSDDQDWPGLNDADDGNCDNGDYYDEAIDEAIVVACSAQICAHPWPTVIMGEYLDPIEIAGPQSLITLESVLQGPI